MWTESRRLYSGYRASGGQESAYSRVRVIAIAPISRRETGFATVAWRDVCTLAAEAFGKLGHDEAAATSCGQQTRGRNGWNR